MAETNTTKKYLDLTGLSTFKTLQDADHATKSAVSVETAATATTGYAKTYIIKQNNTEVGKIDIPKDMVVSSGTVVTLTAGEVEGLAAGTYIRLVIANATNRCCF